MIQALSGTDIGRAVQCICGSTYICPPVQTLLFVVKLSSTVMFPLDSNLDTFSLCREACRGALVPSCQPPSWCASSQVTCSFFASPEPLSCQLLLPCSTLSSGVRTVSRTQDIISNFAFLLHKLSPSSDTTPFVTALDITSMSCVVLVILEHTL